MGVFAKWQPQWAAHRVATFPVRFVNGDKVPAIRGYNRVGLPGSGQLAEKFRDHDADMLGFMCGHRSGVTVLDADTTDEKVLADALSRHGATPLIVRTASGKYHAYYRHNGERRRIRPWRERPIDLLGANGLVVAPPSKTPSGRYQIVKGTLDDLERLPVISGLDHSFYADTNAPLQTTPRAPKCTGDLVEQGRRNKALFEHCMRQAHHCHDFNAVLDVARTFNMQSCMPPLLDADVLKTAKSVWRYTSNGQNRFGQTSVTLDRHEARSLALDHQDALVLLTLLRASNKPDAVFWVANGMAELLGWTRKRLAAARNALCDLGYIKLLRSASRETGPALYCWNRSPALLAKKAAHTLSVKRRRKGGRGGGGRC